MAKKRKKHALKQESKKNLSFKGKIFLLLFGIVVGTLAAIAIFQVWQSFDKPLRKITKSDHNELRQIMDKDSTSAFKFDPDLSFMFKANFNGYRKKKAYPLHTNSKSLLGKIEMDPDPGVKKLLLLGDSVPFGERVGYQKSFISIMQSMAADNIQLGNGTCPGWSTHQEILFYEKYLSDIDWSKIIIIFSLNDLLKYEWVFGSGKNYQMSSELQEVGGLFGATKIKRSLQIRQVKNMFAKNKKTEPLSKHNNSFLFAWIDDQWEGYLAEIFTPFVEDIDKNKLIIVAVPTRPQVEAMQRGASDKIVFYPQRKLKKFIRKNGITMIDMADAFKQADIEVAKTYFKDEAHLSKKGHALIAAYLWPLLEKEI